MMRWMQQKFFAKQAAAADPVFAAPAGVRIYAVGDIHGRHRLLQQMLALIARDAQAAPSLQVVEVFLGDYLDRGPDSCGVITQLLAAPSAGHIRVCLRGNHEAALLDFLNKPNGLREWGSVGGYATLASYGIPIPPSMTPEQVIHTRDLLQKNMPPAHLAFLQQLPYTYACGDYLFVHAGVRPDVPLTQQAPEDLLRIRTAFLQHSGFFPQYVVHGHSPVAQPEILHHRANLDISAASVDSLCCLVIEGTQRRVLVATAGGAYAE